MLPVEAGRQRDVEEVRVDDAAHEPAQLRRRGRHGREHGAVAARARAEATVEVALDLERSSRRASRRSPRRWRGRRRGVAPARASGAAGTWRGAPPRRRPSRRGDPRGRRARARAGSRGSERRPGAQLSRAAASGSGRPGGPVRHTGPTTPRAASTVSKGAPRRQARLAGRRSVAVPARGRVRGRRLSTGALVPAASAGRHRPARARGWRRRGGGEPGARAREEVAEPRAAAREAGGPARGLR